MIPATLALILFILFCYLAAIIAIGKGLAALENDHDDHTKSHTHDLNDAALEPLRQHLDNELRIRTGPIVDRIAAVEVETQRLATVTGLHHNLDQLGIVELTVEEFHQRQHRGTLPETFVVTI